MSGEHLTLTPAWDPRPLDQLRARYPAAVARLYDVRQPPPSPAELGRHVFDFEDGLRLVITCGDDGSGDPLICISASFSAGFGDAILARLGPGFEAMNTALSAIFARFRTLSGETGPLVSVSLGDHPLFFVRPAPVHN